MRQKNCLQGKKFGMTNSSYGTLNLVKKFVIQAVLLISVALAAIALFGPGRQTSLPFGQQTPENKNLKIGTSNVKIEIADSAEEHTSELQSHVNLVCRLL